MKSVKSFAIVALVAIMAVACGKVEKILPKKDGLWQGVSQTTTQYTDNVQDTTYTETDSLGQMMFVKDGTGYSADFSGNNKQDFTWAVNDNNDQITITDTSGFALTLDILESSSKSQTWMTSITIDVLGTVFKTDITSVMERK